MLARDTMVVNFAKYFDDEMKFWIFIYLLMFLLSHPYCVRVTISLMYMYWPGYAVLKTAKKPETY